MSVEFESEGESEMASYKIQLQQTASQRSVSPIIQWLLNTGIVKTKEQVVLILKVITVACFIISILVIYFNFSHQVKPRNATETILERF